MLAVGSRRAHDRGRVFGLEWGWCCSWHRRRCFNLLESTTKEMRCQDESECGAKPYQGGKEERGSEKKYTGEWHASAGRRERIEDHLGEIDPTVHRISKAVQANKQKVAV